MTGRGRCQGRRKSMAGGRDTAEFKKSEKDCSSLKLEDHITETPPYYPEITKPTLYPKVQIDLYTQAGKALSFRSPFDSENSPATQASVSSANNLPTGVSNLLSRHSDNRKRHKKLHSGTEKKSSTSAKIRGSNIWIETEEYFRELILDDLKRLEKFSSLELSNDEKCFLIPILDGDSKLPDRDDTLNGKLAGACKKYNANFEDCVGSNSTDIVNFNEIMSYQNGRCTTNDDGDGVETKEMEIKPKPNAHNYQNSEKHFNSFSGLEWLLGSRSKIYLASERPSKKRKLFGRDAGLEKLLIARPVEGLESVCHYCSCGDMGNPLNCLIKCSSCGVVVHQRCYGVQEDVDNFWLCSWCKWKNVVDLSTETPCLLCPKKGGALKPVGRRGPGGENEGSEMEFAHLFCCLWMQEVYLENTRNMEPIMNMDELKDIKRKLTCSLCKIKYGACVRCSNGSCRTSFHPSCAREASHRLEIWGKLGSDEVEMRCFCSKHSEVQCDSNSEDTVDTSLAEHLKENETNLESANRDVLDPVAIEYTVVAENEEVNPSSVLEFTSILKKLIGLGEVSAEVVASEMGVSSDSLSAILTDKRIPPDLRCKLVRWLKNHAHVRNWQKNLKQKIRSLVVPKDDSEAAECACTGSVEKPSDPDAIPVKSIPHCRRTKSSMTHVTDGMSCTSKDKINDDIYEGDVDLKFTSEDLTVEIEKILSNTNYYEDVEANDSCRTEAENQDLAKCFAEDDVCEKTKLFRHMTSSPFLKIGEVNHASYVHTLIYRKLMEAKSELLQRNGYCESAVLMDREASQSEASSSLGLCCNNNHNLLATSADRDPRSGGVNLDQLVSLGNQDMLKISPTDEVEGELIYYQQRLIGNATLRKHICDELISRLVRNLPRDIEIAGRRKWDALLVNQYNHDLREAKKQGRKERRHKEAQDVLAAATAAAAASSRTSSTRKDNLEDSSQQEDLLKMKVSDSRMALYSQNPQNIFRSAGTRSSSDRNSDHDHFPSGIRNHARTCDICSRFDTVLNPILVCSSCKVSVHLDCYRSVKNTTGPWHCELCEDLISSRGSGVLATNSWEKPYFVPECSLCGGTAGAFRKSGDGQWMHAFCAEWILESTYRRGQVNPIEGKDIACRGADVCIVCHRRQGVCLKCSYGHCQTTFHPNCARSAGFYMTVRTSSGKLQHKAYCEKHSIEQRAKADNQRHGIEEFKSLKQVRVELERLRLLCERIVKREKLKRDLVLCSHDVLATSRDSVLSALARHPFYQPEVSSESATTSLKGHTDGYRSHSEMVQRSDDIAFDRTVAGKRRVRLPVSLDSDQKTDDSSSSQNLHKVKPEERVSFSGKQIPQRLSDAPRDPSDAKFRKHTETFEKELLMTSDQASMKNQRLPKGFVYVPIRCLSSDKETVPDASSPEPAQRKVHCYRCGVHKVTCIRSGAHKVTYIRSGVNSDSPSYSYEERKSGLSSSFVRHCRMH